MDYLNWDLSILSRSVAYNNLSGASSHVGLSQPQLSRIVAKLEDQLGINLLDRETKRKSSWTPAAFKLAEIYTSTFQTFRTEVNQLAEALEPDTLRVGSLEGLVPLAKDLCEKLVNKTDIRVLELNVYDTNVLEEKFLKAELDLIYTIRHPGRKKFSYTKNIGYQSIDKQENGELNIFSSFEFSSKIHKGLPKERCFVSNSLNVRRQWMDTIGGVGTMPSNVKNKKTGNKNEVQVVVVAQDHLTSKFWNNIKGLL
jgi:LysR family transcriptional regulator, transcriptional activator for aaeXAB operon